MFILQSTYIQLFSKTKNRNLEGFIPASIISHMHAYRYVSVSTLQRILQCTVIPFPVCSYVKHTYVHSYLFILMCTYIIVDMDVIWLVNYYLQILYVCTVYSYPDCADSIYSILHREYMEVYEHMYVYCLEVLGTRLCLQYCT